MASWQKKTRRSEKFGTCAAGRSSDNQSRERRNNSPTSRALQPLNGGPRLGWIRRDIGRGPVIFCRALKSQKSPSGDGEGGEGKSVLETHQHCRVFSRRKDNAMKTTPITLLAIFAAASAYALDITTRAGTTYTEVEVQRIEPDGITIKHSTGFLKLHVRELSDADRARFHLTPERFRAYQLAKKQAQLEQAKKDAEEAERKLLAAKTRTFHLYCWDSDSRGIRCYDENKIDYIIRGYEIMPQTEFYVYAVEGQRVKISSSTTAIELFPVEGPDGSIRVRPAGAMRKLPSTAQ